jgi:DNA-directed RNA polymerase subunit RPC12/RpoP
VENNRTAPQLWPRRLRDALFLDEHTLIANCGRCGREVIVSLADIGGKRTIECRQCLSSARGVVLSDRVATEADG